MIRLKGEEMGVSSRLRSESGTRVGRSAMVVQGDGLAEQVYRLLRDDIVEGRLKAGERLSVPEVAAQLGVSRSPVREAITRLAYGGLAVLEPRRGAVVATITLEELRDIYEIREVLEGLVCRLAAERITDEAILILDAAMARHRAAVEAGDSQAHKDLDQLFHQLLRASARHARVAESLNVLQDQIRMAMGVTGRGSGAPMQALADHEAILLAVRARNRTAAEAAGRAHVARLLSELEGAEPDRPVGARHLGG